MLPTLSSHAAGQETAYISLVGGLLPVFTILAIWGFFRRLSAGKRKRLKLAKELSETDKESPRFLQLFQATRDARSNNVTCWIMTLHSSYPTPSQRVLLQLSPAHYIGRRPLKPLTSMARVSWILTRPGLC